MLRRIIRWLFGTEKSPETFRVVGDGPDPYRDHILNEVMRTGGMIGGSIEDNGDLIVQYPDGSSKRVPKSELK